MKKKKRHIEVNNFQNHNMHLKFNYLILAMPKNFSECTGLSVPEVKFWCKDDHICQQVMMNIKR